VLKQISSRNQYKRYIHILTVMHKQVAISAELLKCEKELACLKDRSKFSGLNSSIELRDLHFLGAGVEPIKAEDKNPTMFAGIHYTIRIHSKEIDVICDEKLRVESKDKKNFEKIFAMKAFVDWCANVEQELLPNFSQIIVESYNMFGPRVGFVKFRTNMQIPSITFMRGGSVAMLVILKSKQTGQRYCPITLQARVPVGKHALAEIPAGMLDDSDNFAGAAAKELNEEVGLTINKTDLVDLLLFTGLSRAQFPGIYLSPGGCDEFMKFYLYVTELEQEAIDKLHGKLTGEFNEGEQITLKVVKFEQLADECCADAKTMIALFLYSQLCEGMKDGKRALTPLPRSRTVRDCDIQP